MKHIVARRLGTALVAGVVAAAGIAQTGTYSNYGTPCTNDRNVYARVYGSLPARGEEASVTVTGAGDSLGLLCFAGSDLLPGLDLSGGGMTGCKLIVGLDQSFLLPIVLSSAGSRRLTFQVPASLPIGARYYNQAFLHVPQANPAGWITSNGGCGTIGYGRDLTLSEILEFAPLVRLHPDEAYNPVDPMQFVRLARFRHHRGGQSDQGYNKTTAQWVTTNSKSADYYNVPVAFLASYGLHANGQNRRPRDSNSGSSWNVFLETDDREAGDPAPTGRIPAFYYYRRSGDVHEVQYWWFLGFNDAPATINHQGDWEHVTVKITGGAIQSVYFAAHNGGTTYHRSAVQFAGTHPVVYVAKGTHASYPKAGSFYGSIDKTADGGHQWRIRDKLYALKDQPWRDFAGAWGAVGLIDTTTGPLGPWHKRNAP